MTDAEKKIADDAAAKAADKAIKDEADRVAKEAADKAALEANDPLKKKDEEIAKLKEDRDNYKAVALKRLGKNSNDAEFLGNSELTVADQIKLALLDKEIDSAEKAKDETIKGLTRQVSELTLALKNRPNPAMGGDGGAGPEVKDNVFSAEQINVMKQKAIRLKMDPDKFVENAKKNFIAKR